MSPVILGMNNPLSMDPRYALWPDPPGCSGWRLWKMLEERTGASQEDYVAGFERRNVLTGLWSASAARGVLFGERGETVLPIAGSLVDQLRGRTVVLLGEAPRRVLGLRPDLVVPQVLYGVTWRCVPHPSGLCRWYNDRTNRETVGMLLENLLSEARTG
jgi:hypothetical protein